MGQVSTYFPDYSLPTAGQCSSTAGVDPNTGAQVSGQIAVSLAKASGALASNPATVVAAPFVAAAGAISQAVSAAYTLFSGCGATCVLASDYANSAESLLNQIKSAYFAAPSPRTVSFQNYALQAVAQVFNWLGTMCSCPNLGTAGQRCISERLVQGGSAPWCPTGTGCDWITTYYVPIAEDATVPDSTTTSTGTSTVSTAVNSLSSSISQLTGGNVSPDLIMAGGLLLLALLL